MAHVAEREAVDGRLGHVRNDVAGPDALLVAAGILNRGRNGNATVAHLHVEADAAVLAPREDVDVGVVGLVIEDGVGVEVFEHRFEPSAHDPGRVEVIDVAGDQLFIDRAEDFEILAQGKEIIVARHPEPGRHAKPQDRSDDGDEDETLGFHGKKGQSSRFKVPGSFRKNFEH